VTLYARLDKKDDCRVLCGRPRCSGQLAWIGEPRTTIRFESGWTCEGTGVWRQSRHAREAVKRGFKPSFARGSQKLECGCVVGRYRDWEISSGSLPINARCPRCSAENTLDVGRLGLVPAARFSGDMTTIGESAGIVWVGSHHSGVQHHRCRP
jgi:hypothetical protein